MRCLLALAMLSLTCCDDGRAPAGPQAEAGAAKLTVSLSPLSPQSVGRVTAELTAADMDTLRQDLTIGADGTARGIISSIPVGAGRKVELSVYSTDDLRTHAGYTAGLTVVEAETLDVAIALLPLSGAVGVSGTILDSNETVTYAVTLNATWSEATHPRDFPNVPHFSGLIGVIHNSNVRFWEEGQLASNGIKDMSEVGKKVTLQGEFAIARRNGNAGNDISGGEVNPSPGRLTLDFEVERQFPLVTLVCMIAPTPDWFVGTNGLSLLNEDGTWKLREQVELFGYDAGTDSGTSYSSPNQATVPREPIAALAEGVFRVEGEVPRLGTFTFVRR